MGLDLAIAASARDWPDRLHRHVLDHGGARVVGRLMGPSQCVDTLFDVIFVDDVCSFLTPRLVTLLRQRERAVVGVFDPADSPDAKRRLLECGISDVIESNATAQEFLNKASGSIFTSKPLLTAPSPRLSAGRAVGVVGVTDGVGSTELAAALAASVSRRTNAVLVDLDPAWPSVAQRLDLSPYPNLRTLIDVTFHQGVVDQAIQWVGGLGVIAGSVSDPSPTPIPGHEAAMALDVLSESTGVIVGDLGAEERVNSTLLGSFESVILVAAADPVGLARLVRAYKRLSTMVDQTRLLVAVNLVPDRRFYRSEIRSEVSLLLGGGPFTLLPRDQSVTDSAWNGGLPRRGPFVREVDRIADLVADAVVA